MPYEITHAVRGRLRVRYPVVWLRTRRDVVVRLRSLPGVRAVSGSPVTGSVRIDYDPFRLAEQGIVATLRELDQRLGGTPVDHPAAPRRPRLVQRKTPLLNVLATSSVLAATCLPVPPALVAGLVFASETPALLRATTALRRRRLNGDVLEASTLLLLAARRHYMAAALLTWLRSVGEFVVARTVVTARRSLHDVVAPPDAVTQRVEGDAPRPVRVSALRVWSRWARASRAASPSRRASSATRSRGWPRASGVRRASPASCARDR